MQISKKHLTILFILLMISAFFTINTSYSFLDANNKSAYEITNEDTDSHYTVKNVSNLPSFSMEKLLSNTMKCLKCKIISVIN